VHWAEQLSDIGGQDLAKRLVLAAYEGKISTEHAQLGANNRRRPFDDGETFRSTVDELTGGIMSVWDLLYIITEEGFLQFGSETRLKLSLSLHRDGVLTFAARYGFPPPSWWAANAALPAVPRAPGQRGTKPVKRDRAIAKMRPWISQHGWAAFDEMTDDALMAEFDEKRATCRAAREKLRQERPTNSDKTPTTNN
jgi:hypothetical protein